MGNIPSMGVVTSQKRRRAGILDLSPAQFVRTSYVTTGSGTEHLLIYLPRGYWNDPTRNWHTHLFYHGDGGDGQFTTVTKATMTHAGSNLYTLTAANSGSTRIGVGTVIFWEGNNIIGRCRRDMNGTTGTVYGCGARPSATGTIELDTSTSDIQIQLNSAAVATISVSYEYSALFETGLPDYLNNGTYDWDDTIVAMVQKAENDDYFVLVDHYEDLLAFLVANYHVDTNRITVSGLSRGAFMVSDLMESSYFSEIAAFIMNSGGSVSLADWSTISDKGFIYCIGQDENLDGYSVVSGTILNATGALNLHNYPMSIMVEDGRHNATIWNTNCYNVSTALYDFRDWCSVWSLDYDEQATLHVEMAEARVNIDRWREAKRAVYFMTAGALKTALEARLATLKTTIDNGKKRWNLKFGVTAETETYLNTNYLNTNFQASTTYSSLKDDNNNTTGFGLTVNNQFASSPTNRFSASTRGSNAQFGWTQENYNDGISMQTAITTGQFTITGADPAKTYKFTIYFANGSTSKDHIQEIDLTVDGSNQVKFDTYNNRVRYTFTGVTPDGSGNIVVAGFASGDTTTILQVLTIEEE